MIKMIVSICVLSFATLAVAQQGQRPPLRRARLRLSVRKVGNKDRSGQRDSLRPLV